MDPIRFRALGFPVRVEPSFFLTVAVALLFRLSDGGPLVLAFTWGAVLFVSVLTHELGHALAARSLRVPVGTISLHALGGQVETGRAPPARSLAVSVSGPAAGLVLGGATLAAAPFLPSHGVAGAIVGDLLAVNIGWSLFNLLPLFPLDGGNALRAALALVTREVTAWRFTAGVGVLLGVLLAVFGWQSGMIFVAWIGGYAAWTNWQLLDSLQR